MMTDNVDSQTPEPVPPSAERVARRAMVLATVSCRGVLELGQGDQASSSWARVAGWWSRLGLESELEPSEAALLAAAFGTPTQQALVDASWRSEALCVFAWALRRAKLPPHDAQANPAATANALGFLTDQTVLQSATIRTSAELTSYFNLVFTLHWRLREFSLRPAALDFAQFCKTAPFGPLSLDGVRLIEGDLAIGELPISRASERSIRTVTSIARERHQAANWLTDAALPFSETDTNT